MSDDGRNESSKPKVRRPLTSEQKAEVAAAPYEHGFGKPPTAFQFKKGVSGNPSGRPKEARSLRTDVLAVLDLEVQVQLPGGPEKVSMQRAMVLSAGAKAAKGDMRAAAAMIRLMELTTPERLKDAAECAKLDPVEQAQLESLLATLGLGAPPSTPASAASEPSVANLPEETDDGDEPGFEL